MTPSPSPEALAAVDEAFGTIDWCDQNDQAARDLVTAALQARDDQIADLRLEYDEIQRLVFGRGYQNQIAALQAELGAARVLMREAADKMASILVREAGNIIESMVVCDGCDGQAYPGMRPLVHTPDCLITRLRSAAGPADGGTNG